MIRTKHLCVILVYCLFCVSISGANTTGCGECGWILNGLACYWISSDVDSLHSWNDAKSICERRQAVLASVNTENHAFLIDEMEARGSMHWLGFYKPNQQNTFEYLDGSTEEPYLTFRDGDRTKPSVEKKSEDCAGIAYTDTISDIWWEDEKCNQKNYYICMKRIGNITITTGSSSNTTAAATTITTTMMLTTTKNLSKIAVFSIGNYKPRKIRTVPPTSDPISVISGTSAIIIIISVIAFIIGSDVTSFFCRVKLCSQKRSRYNARITDNDITHDMFLRLEQENSQGELDLCVRFKNHYCCAVKPNGKLIKTQKLDVAYLIQNESNMEVWVRHMVISTGGSSIGEGPNGGYLHLEQILIDHVAKSQSPGKYSRSQSICDSVVNSKLGHKHNIKPVIEGVHKSSPFSVTAIIGSGKNPNKTPISGATYTSRKKDRIRPEEKAPPGKVLVKVVDPDTKQPIHAAYTSSRASSRSNMYPRRNFRKPSDVLPETHVATCVGSAKTNPKHSQESTKFVGSVKIWSAKER